MHEIGRTDEVIVGSQRWTSKNLLQQMVVQQ
jgi:hypothetical protein